MIAGPIALGLTLWAAGSQAAQTRSYVLGMFHVATYSSERFGPDENCRGSNGKAVDVERRILTNLYGYSKPEADKILLAGKDKAGTSLRMLIRERGKIDGKPASVYMYPKSAPQTKDLLVEGRYAYGFDLDGKGADQRTGFEDPETHQQGVDNELFRILGCYAQYDINLPVRPYYEEGVWLNGLLVTPAWAFSVTGENLDKDGDVVIDFYKTIEHPRPGADGEVLQGATYTIDPNPRSFGRMKGRIVGGMLTASGDEVALEGEMPLMGELRLHKPQLRLKLSPDGTANGYIGGYQPWIDYWYFVAAYDENQQGVDLNNLWYHFEKLSDGVPDPKTGKNTAISATYRIESVQSHLVPAPPYVPPRSLRARN